MHHGINILWPQPFSPPSVGVGPDSRRARASELRPRRVRAAWLASTEPFAESTFNFTNPLTTSRVLTTVFPRKPRRYPGRPVSPETIRENPG